jgi:ATP-dependent helicase HrpA
VDVRLFETAEAARRAMRAGTRRLVLLAVKSPANEVAKRLTTTQKLVLSDNPHGSVPALFADCVACAVDRLVDEAGGPARDAAGFARIVEHVRPRLHAATYEVVTWAEEILRGAHETRLRLDGLRGQALAPAVADIREQLDGLIAPGFLTAAGAARLPALARYVKAVGRRLDKLTDNAGRDAQQMAVVHRVQDAYAGALAARPPEVRQSDAAADIRWQVEELRVSLFAQTIGTPQPVSERRIMTAIQNLA